MMAQLKQACHENRLEVKIKWFCRYKLLIIDEVGYEKMDPDTANLFFNLISKRYEKTSTIITTNLIIEVGRYFWRADTDQCLTGLSTVPLFCNQYQWTFIQTEGSDAESGRSGIEKVQNKNVG